MSILETPDILFEDNHLLVAVKPSGVMSQAGRSAAPDMLTLLKRHIKLRDYKPGEVFLGLVHRLDQPTSGLMVFAKTSKAAGRLSESFRGRDVEKLYLAVVRGIPERLEGSLIDYLSKKIVNGRVTRDDQGDEAILQYQCLMQDKAKNESLLLINLVTGRRHQIRAQLSLRGMPVLGDRRYGKTDSRDREVPTLALHAAGLSFIHPVKKERLTFWQGPQINPSFPKALTEQLSEPLYFNDFLP